MENVSAAFNFQLGEQGDASSLQMFVDGVDVTSKAIKVGTRDWPSSDFNITYTRNFSEPGTHNSQVRFRTLDGKTKSYSWSFSIKSP